MSSICGEHIIPMANPAFSYGFLEWLCSHATPALLETGFVAESPSENEAQKCFSSNGFKF